VKLFILISRLLKAAAESADGAFSVSSVSVTHAIFLLARINGNAKFISLLHADIDRSLYACHAMFPLEKGLRDDLNKLLH